MKITFSETAQKALELIEETSENLFLTGKAGTGKSTLLDYFRENTEKKVAILAPTGVAAVNVHGETIHSFFGLKPNFELEEAKRSGKKPKNPGLYKRLQTIVIDEISMVRADLLDAIDIFLQNARENPEPFGGVQMVFIGDLYQLPPVVTRDDKTSFSLKYNSPFFFAAGVFETGNFHMNFIELDEVYRQSDNDFINILNAVRNKTVTSEHLSKLNKQVDKFFEPEDDDFIYLVTTNYEAKQINEAKLKELEGKELYFEANVSGKVKKNLFPADDDLYLKVGAQIMFLNNDSTRRWVNGTIGKIIEFDEISESLTVELTDGNIVDVEPHNWDISKYVLDGTRLKRETIGTFIQYPLRLAWAITIHKSQGKTFDKVIIDLGRGSFAHGQTYVALSRCRTLEGIVFRKPILKSHVIMDSNVRRFLTDYQCALSEKELSLESKIEFLISAMDKEKPLKLSYLKANDERKNYHVQPLLVDEMEFKGVKFLGMRAQCLEKNTEITFCVKRILEILG